MHPMHFSSLARNSLGEENPHMIFSIEEFDDRPYVGEITLMKIFIDVRCRFLSASLNLWVFIMLLATCEPIRMFVDINRCHDV